MTDAAAGLLTRKWCHRLLVIPIVAGHPSSSYLIDKTSLHMPPDRSIESGLLFLPSMSRHSSIPRRATAYSVQIGPKQPTGVIRISALAIHFDPFGAAQICKPKPQAMNYDELLRVFIEIAARERTCRGAEFV